MKILKKECRVKNFVWSGFIRADLKIDSSYFFKFSMTQRICIKRFRPDRDSKQTVTIYI